MISAEQLFGMEGVALPSQAGLTLPDMVPGRVLQLDADILAYHCSFDPETTIDQAIGNYQAEAGKYAALAGAEFVNHHVTGSGSSKGGRFEAAIQKPYQGNRDGKPKPMLVEPLREYVRDTFGARGFFCMDREADDSLCIEQQKAIDAGQRDLSVIWSADKDLLMMEGLHLCNDTYNIVDVVGYGGLRLDRSKSTPKIRGWGTAMFWAQMLTGDTADNIQGLIHLTGEMLNKYKPNKASLAANTPEKLAKVAASRKPAPCGAVTVAEILGPCRTDKEAATRVIELYQQAYGADWQRIMRSEAQLLWMRRWSADEGDFRLFFQEVMK